MVRNKMKQVSFYNSFKSWQISRGSLDSRSSKILKEYPIYAPNDKSINLCICLLYKQLNQLSLNFAWVFGLLDSRFSNILKSLSSPIDHKELFIVTMNVPLSRHRYFKSKKIWPEAAFACNCYISNILTSTSWRTLWSSSSVVMISVAHVTTASSIFRLARAFRRCAICSGATFQVTGAYYKEIIHSFQWIYLYMRIN